MSLEGKKILLIATSFFGYEKKIKEAMEELGGEVSYYDERCIKSAWEKAILKISPRVFKKKTTAYYKKIIQNNIEKKYDYIFIYGATMMDRDIVKLLRSFFSGEMILYLADSIRGNKRYENMFSFFDRVVTFDRADYEYYRCIINNIYFLPLFYSREYKNPICTVKYRYDLCFIGTVHSDRIEFLEKIKRQADENNLVFFCYPYLQSKFMFYYYYVTKKSFRKKRISDFKYDKLSTNSIKEIVTQSQVLVDAQFPKNTGLTMRTIEAVGLNKKLLTANEDIKNYNFFNSNNILVVDRKKPEIDKLFFQTEFVEIPDDIYNSYYITSWIERVLGIAEYQEKDIYEKQIHDF